MEEFKPIHHQTRTYKVVDDVETLDQILNVCDSGTIFVAHDVELTQEHIEKAKERFISIQIVKDMHEVKAYINDTVFNKPLA